MNGKEKHLKDRFETVQNVRQKPELRIEVKLPPVAKNPYRLVVVRGLGGVSKSPNRVGVPNSHKLTMVVEFICLPLTN